MHIFIRTVLFAGLLFTATKVVAQAADPAALQARLASTKQDTARVGILLKLSAYYNNLAKPLPQTAKALAYSLEAEKLSVSLNYKPGLANSYAAQAKTWRNKQDTGRAMVYLRRAKETFVKDSLFREAAEVVLNMEEFYQYFGGGDIKVRTAYYEQALLLFQRTQAKDRLEATLKVLGDFYQVQGDYTRALEYLQRALTFEQYIKPMDKEGLYDLLGYVYASTGNLDKALFYGLATIKITEQIRDTTMQACAVYNRVGITYYTMRQFAHAKTFFEKSLAIAIKNRDIQSQINQYANIGQALIKLNRFQDCVTLLTRVIRKYPAAEIKRYMGLDLRLLICYMHLKKPREAKEAADRLEAASLATDPNNNFQLVIQSFLAEYYASVVQDEPTRKHVARLKMLSIKQQNPVALSRAYVFEGRLDSAENKLADAYRAYRIAGNISEKVWNENQSKQVSELQMQFDDERKDQQLKQKAERIKLLSTQARLQQVNLEQEKTMQRLIIGGTVLLVILLAWSYRAYYLKKRVNRQLHAQQAEIQRKNESLNRLVNEKDYLLTEKEWLMKEIHHRVKNNLQIVISLLSTQSQYLDDDAAYNAIRESQHRMQSISLIHQKLYQSENLALVDIHAYISDLVDYLRESFDTDPRISFEIAVDHTEMDVTRAVPLGLILNEAITNAIKYAFSDGRSGKIAISLTEVGNTFRLKIQDNGVGLPHVSDISKSKSLGISLMRGLSKQLGGSLTVESGKGITIIVDFINEQFLKAV